MRRALPVAVLSALLVVPLTWVDLAVRDRVQASRRPALEAPMQAITKGSRTLLVVSAAVGLVAGPIGRAVVFEAVVALAPVNLAVEGLKWCVGRTRPDGDSRRRNSSFPSSHSANAWAVATVLTRRWRRGWPAFALLAALVSFSRMYLDRHYLSDVFAGALLGVGLTLLSLWLFERWKRPKSAPTAT